MTRRRRTYEIEMPADVPNESSAEDAKSARRGPMASAIAENAEALQARKSAAELIREENDALAHEYVAMRDAGQIVKDVPLDHVNATLLLRDRMPGEDPELADLVTSIRELGLSNPIRVLPRPDGDGVELLQGFRRLAAYKQLFKDTGDAQWAKIPALVLSGETDIDGLYRRMVDENVIRKDLSFAEMARAAQNYAADPMTEANDLGQAVAKLFQSAPYSKRSYIRLFASLLDHLGDVLLYPTEIPRALGVDFARAIKDRPEVVGSAKNALNDWPQRSIQDELDVLRQVVGGDEISDTKAGASESKAAAAGEKAPRTKTTFHIGSRAGQIKCTAGPGRLEIKVDRDFSSIDRARLERAVASLIDGLA